MNKKLNTALDYLEELITNHQLRHTKRVNIRDNALLAKYFPNNVTNLSVSFSRDIIKPLSESGYIICVDNRQIRKMKARYYKVDTLKIAEDKDISTAYSMLTTLNNSLSIIPILPYNHNKTQFETVLKKINSVDPMKFSEIKFATKDLTRDEVNELAAIYELKLLKENKVLKAVRELCGADTTCKLNMNVKYGEKISSFKPSCRQCSDLARVSKKDWYRVNKTNGLNSFDLHGAIFSITRILNGGHFDPHQDIKKVIYTQQGEDDKELLNRVFFCKSPKQAAAQYNFKRRYEKPWECLPVEYFERLSEEVDNFCLGTSEYRNNIFLYESLLELLVRKEVRDCGYQCYTVFDCFYYDCDDDLFLDILSTISNHFNEIIYSLYF